MLKDDNSGAKETCASITPAGASSGSTSSAGSSSAQTTCSCSSSSSSSTSSTHRQQTRTWTPFAGATPFHPEQPALRAPIGAHRVNINAYQTPTYQQTSVTSSSTQAPQHTGWVSRRSDNGYAHPQQQITQQQQVLQQHALRQHAPQQQHPQMQNSANTQSTSIEITIAQINLRALIAGEVVEQSISNVFENVVAKLGWTAVRAELPDRDQLPEQLRNLITKYEEHIIARDIISAVLQKQNEITEDQIEQIEQAFRSATHLVGHANVLRFDFNGYSLIQLANAGRLSPILRSRVQQVYNEYQAITKLMSLIDNHTLSDSEVAKIFSDVEELVGWNFVTKITRKKTSLLEHARQKTGVLSDPFSKLLLEKETEYSQK